VFSAAKSGRRAKQSKVNPPLLPVQTGHRCSTDPGPLQDGKTLSDTNIKRGTADLRVFWGIWLNCYLI